MPPYIVFSDKTLIEMSAERPSNKEKMMKISGVGETKYNRYGELFIAKIKEYKE